MSADIVSISCCSYMAGLIDGEGYIGVSVAMPGGTRITPSFRIRVKIAMCERGAIEFARDNFGGAILRYGRKNPKHRPLYEWHVTGRAAALLLHEVLPYLKIKSEQARLAIELFNRVKATSVMPKRGQRGLQRTALDEIAVRDSLWQRIKLLNARGVH